MSADTLALDFEVFAFMFLNRKRAGMPFWQSEVYAADDQQAAPLFASPFRTTREQCLDDADRFVRARVERRAKARTG